MARVFSRDQGRFIDQPGAGGRQAPTGYGGGGQDMMQQLMMAQLASQATGKKPGFSDIYDILQPEPSEAEAKAVRAESDLDRRLRVVESLWFPHEDKLAMSEPGTWVERQTHKLKMGYKASSEYELFRRQAKTLGASLAKAAGDTGNIAWAEQAAQLQAIANVDLTKEEAEATFKNMREALNISKEKDYFNQLRKGTDRRDGEAPQITPTGAPPTGGAEIPYGALGQIVGGRLPFPANIAAAGGIGGLGTAIPQTQERVGRALEGDIPSYPEQLKESFTGMGQVGKTTGINALLQAILSPIKTFGGLRDVRAGVSPLTVSGGRAARAAAETARTAPAAEQVGATSTAQQALQRYGGQTLGAREALAQKTKEWAAGRTAGGGAGQVSKSIAGSIKEQISEQDKFIAIMDALQSILLRGKETAGGIARRYGPTAVGLGVGGYGASRFLGK